MVELGRHVTATSTEYDGASDTKVITGETGLVGLLNKDEANAALAPLAGRANWPLVGRGEELDAAVNALSAGGVVVAGVGSQKSDLPIQTILNTIPAHFPLNLVRNTSRLP